MSDLGTVLTRDESYRARAEARQREYRARTLNSEPGRYGHLLSKADAVADCNFVTAEAHQAARARQRAGKGVSPSTFENMLSSQAMWLQCLLPLSARLALAGEVLRPLVPGLAEVTSSAIEHIPAADVFKDQTGRGGVACGLLIEGTNLSGVSLVLASACSLLVDERKVHPELPHGRLGDLAVRAVRRHLIGSDHHRVVRRVTSRYGTEVVFTNVLMADNVS